MSTETQSFKISMQKEAEAKQIIMSVCRALEQKGYNPVNQIAGYLLSGDPTYITSFEGARKSIRKLERDEIIEELLKFYITNND